MSILIYKQRHRHPNYKKTPKGNYAHIGYIATRPGAVKNEGMRHGLFGKLEPGVVKEFDTWQEAARLVRELSYRRVNMYRGIISFSPETAAELGLSDHKAWEDYIDRHILTLAKFNGIRVQDLQWVAAHHNEKGHPHIHVVFWNKHQRTMVPFVHPSIPDKIRKQLIRDTFAERIKEYCEAKQRAKEHLSAITDEMIDEFEKYMEHLHPQEYRRLREAFGRITDDELGTSPLDSVVGAMKIAPFISRLFALKEKMPKKGRLYYKLLPEDVKAELDAFVAFLKENNEYIRNLVQDYAESKTRLAMLYDTDPAHIKEQQEKAVAEADKLIANKILDVIRTMLCKDREVQSFEYTEARKAYFTEQMICEILMALEQTATFLQLPILYVSDDMVKNQKMIRQSDRPLDINDCIPDSSQYNYENQFLVLKPGVSSKGKDMTADDSIWYARNGFGCIYGARGQAVYAESLLTGKYIHWERHDFCGIVKPESLKEWLLDKPVRNEAAEELTKFVTPELISAAKQNHTACGYPFLIGYAPAEGGLHEAFCLDPDPVNLASFIVKMGKERGDLMICTPLDTPFLNTFGTFIDRCADQDFLQKHLLPVLVPMQMGETEPQAIKLTEDQDNEAFLDDFAVEDDMEL